jgi:hypothetical protein
MCRFLGKLTIFGAVTLLFRNLHPASAENGKNGKKRERANHDPEHTI